MSDNTIQRTIGARSAPEVGGPRPPSPQDMARCRSLAALAAPRGPKGVYRYHTVEQADADRRRWLAEALAERARQNEMATEKP